jgi:hypothetical protein
LVVSLIAFSLPFDGSRYGGFESQVGIRGAGIDPVDEAGEAAMD